MPVMPHFASPALARASLSLLSASSSPPSCLFPRLTNTYCSLSLSLSLSLVVVTFLQAPFLHFPRVAPFLPSFLPLSLSPAPPQSDLASLSSERGRTKASSKSKKDAGSSRKKEDFLDLEFFAVSGQRNDTAYVVYVYT